MKNYNDINVGFFKLQLAFIIFILTISVNPLLAQNFSRVVNLAFNGKTATTVNVSVMPPGSGNKKSQITVGDNVFSGTKLVIPPNTIVALQSPSGKQVLRATDQIKAMEYTLTFTAQGEIHTVSGIGGQIISTVKKIAGYNYKVNNGKGTTAAARGTEFTFTDYSRPGAEKASIVTTEGTINIIDQVPVTIKGIAPNTKKKGGTLTKSVSTVQSAGQEYYSTNEPANFYDYAEAISVLTSELKFESYPDERADDLTCLGDLLMDNNQAQKAIGPYDEALQIYEEEYGFEDLFTLEAKLSLADAYIMSGQDVKGNNLFYEVESILLDFMKMDLEDLDYVREDGDKEGEYLICDDIIEIYGLLGWAYDIFGDEVNRDLYYNKMEEGCQ